MLPLCPGVKAASVSGMQRTGEVCEQCGREFESRNKLFRHLRSDQHREEKGGEDKTDDRDSENVESSVEGHNEKDEERAEGNRKKRVSRAGRVARRRMKNSKNFSEKEVRSSVCNLMLSMFTIMEICLCRCCSQVSKV